MTLFKEFDGSYSWRKILTALSGFVWTFAAIGYLFGLQELPPSYIGMISGVWIFYFFKKTIGNMSIGTK